MDLVGRIRGKVFGLVTKLKTGRGIECDGDFPLSCEGDEVRCCFARVVVDCFVCVCWRLIA